MDRKILFCNRHFRLFVRLCNADSHFEPYRSLLTGDKQGFIRPIAKRLEWPDAVTVLLKAEQ